MRRRLNLNINQMYILNYNETYNSELDLYKMNTLQLIGSMLLSSDYQALLHSSDIRNP